MKKLIPSLFLCLLLVGEAKAFPALEFEDDTSVKKTTRSPASVKTLTFRTYVVDSIFDPCQASKEELNKAFERVGISHSIQRSECELWGYHS